MTYKPISIYKKYSSSSNTLEYTCIYLNNNGSSTKARITPATFNNLNNNMSIPFKIFTNQKKEIK